MRLLVTGAGGQVGRELVEWCEATGDEIVACDHGMLDVTDRDATHALLLSIRPDAIVHAAAWTAVDACESDPERAFRANAIGTRNVVEAARRIAAHLTYISTDYVFDGEKDQPYVEWDEPSPRSVYGRSKLAGELEVARHPESAIVRISWVCGRFGHNMVKTALRLAAQPGQLTFVDDQIGNPTIVGDLVPMLRRLAVERRTGTYHVTNQGSVSWFGFVRDVLIAAGDDPDRVHAIRTADLDPPRPAPRPANSVLDNAALRQLGLPLLPDYRESLRGLVDQIRADTGVAMNSVT